jgi:hypothetical protein
VSLSKTSNLLRPAVKPSFEDQHLISKALDTSSDDADYGKPKIYCLGTISAKSLILSRLGFCTYYHIVRDLRTIVMRVD